MRIVNGFAAALMLATVGTAVAEIPQGYYSGLDGKSGSDLTEAIQTLSKGHTRIAFGDKTWEAFETMDVRTVGDRTAWMDMYSNYLVYLPDHESMDREHAVANSWWGGKSGSGDAYADLFHLNPSDRRANGRKSNNPLGVVAPNPQFDNGLTKIGAPAAGYGGGATSVFEPADEYKGDFARAYFYIFTAYADIPWIDNETHAYMYESDGTLQPWAYNMLMAWHRADPVDSREKNRNEEVYKLQKNRNPFIDYPELAEYVWGAKKADAVAVAALTESVAKDRPAAPVINNGSLVNVNTYTERWWDGLNLSVDAGDADRLYVSIDGRDYYEPTGAITIDPANAHGQTHTILAYCESDLDGMTLRSSVTRLDMTARDPELTDYTRGIWEQVKEGETVSPTEKYILLSSNTLHVMSVKAGGTFMESAGFVQFDDDKVCELPVDAAMVEFSDFGADGMTMKVSDMLGNSKGYWNSTDEKTMSLASTGSLAKVSMDLGNQFKFDLGTSGTLKYNAQQPRFNNYYKSPQTPVYLYRFTEFPSTVGVENIAADDTWVVGINDKGDIVISGEAEIYDLSGRKVSGRSLSHGVYIVVGNGSSQKVAF